MGNPVFPIDYNALRKALVEEVQKVTHLTCIVAEPETQNEPRPPKPYFTMKITSPAIKSGDDAAVYVTNTLWNRGGQREMIVSFNCYAKSHEEAYNYMALWQSSLDLETVQGDLYKAGIAVWLNTTVRDLSMLLNTAFEGRSQMDVHFGIASNLTEDLSNMDIINVQGTITTDQGNTDTINVTVDAP